MSLTVLKMTNSLSWSQKKTITGFEDAVQTGPLQITVAPSVTSLTAKEIDLVRGTLAASGNVTLDLSSVTTQAFGDVITPSGAYILLFQGTGAAWKYEPTGVNAFTWFLGGTAPTISGAAGDSFSFASTTAQTIDGTHKNIKITNLSGSATLIYRFAIALKTA